MKGIRTNAVGPGFVETHLTQGFTSDKEAYDFLVEKHPIGRLGKIERIVDLVLWLSSVRASFGNGGYYAVDGGYLAK